MSKKGLRMRKITVLLLGSVFIVGALTLGVSAAQKKTKELTYWEYHVSEFPKAVIPIYERFEKEHDVKLIIDSMAFAELPKKAMIAAEAGQLPDLLEACGWMLVPHFASRGYFEPLDPYIEKEGGEKFLAQYQPWIMPRFNGKVYALPIYSGITQLYYNKTKFKEAGIAGPPKTWEELVSAAIKLTDPKKGVWGLALNGGDEEMYLNSVAPFVIQNGGKIGKVDGEFQINSPESVGGIQFLLDLINKHKVVPSFISATGPIYRELFYTGKAAMMYEASWIAATIKEGAGDKFEWDLTVLPKGRVTGAPLAGADTTIAMSSSCRDKETGWEFLKYFASEEIVYEFTSYTGGLPATKGTYEREDMKNHPFLRSSLRQAGLPNVINVYWELPPQVAAALDILKIELHRAVIGEKTAKQAMDAIAKEWTELDREWIQVYGPYKKG